MHKEVIIPCQYDAAAAPLQRENAVRPLRLTNLFNGVKLIPMVDKTNQSKATHRKKLLAKFAIKPDPKTPIVSMVTRLTRQKGIDLVKESWKKLADGKLIFILLGSGDERYEKFFAPIAKSSAKSSMPVGIHIGYDDELASLIYKGSDFLLMPSLFEPCGIAQMLAQREGTLPIVRKTGGLIDTVKAYSDYAEEANGFAFEDYDAKAMMGAVSEAIEVYKNEELFSRLRMNAMATDNSMDKSAGEYVKVYESLLDANI
jgi:starch synthase